MNANHASNFTLGSSELHLLHDAAHAAAPRLRQQAIADFWGHGAALLTHVFSRRQRTARVGAASTEATASARGACLA